MSDQAAATFFKDRRKLMSIAIAIVGDQASAEDVVQQSWIRWAERNYEADKAGAIFRRIVANLAKDLYRRRQVESRILGEMARITGSEPDSERVYIARQDLLAVVRALRELPERSVLAFRMHAVDGLSCSEVGRRLGLKRSRAQVIISEAMVYVMLRLDG